MRQLKIVKQITNRESLSLDKYLKEISKEPLINAEEEVELARKIHTGDINALQKLVRANLRFVVSVVKQYQNKGLSLPDLINEGNLGLIKAAQLFDETRGFKFISYAVWWIRQSILGGLYEKSVLIRKPLNQISLLSKIYKVEGEFEQEHERIPTDEELAQILEQDPDKIKFLRENSLKVFSFDNIIFNPDENKETSFVYRFEDRNSPQPDKDLMKESLSTDLKSAMLILGERDREILKLYFGIGMDHAMTLEEIGERFNLTRERIRQLKDKAIKRLSKSPKLKFLKRYLD